MSHQHAETIGNLLVIAIDERDALWDALRTDKQSPETQAAIERWKAAKHVAAYFPSARTSELIATIRPRYGYGDFQRGYQSAIRAAVEWQVDGLRHDLLELDAAHAALAEDAQRAYEGQSSSFTGEVFGKHCDVVNRLVDLVQPFLTEEEPAAQDEPPATTPANQRESGGAIPTGALYD